MLSIDIGSRTIRACEGRAKAGSAQIERVAEIRIPPDAVDDGRIRNVPSVLASLKAMLAQQKFRSRDTVMTFNSSEILSRRLELPPSKPYELRQMARHEMMQVVNEAEDFFVEYSLSNPTPHAPAPDAPGAGPMLGLWAYAVPREIVDGYYALFKDLRLKPVALDIHQNTTEKVFTNAEVNGMAITKKAVLVGDMGSASLGIHLFCDGERAFSRITPLPSREFEDLLRNIGYRHRNNVFETVSLFPDDLKGDAMLRSAATQYFSRISDEFQKMIQFQLRRDSLTPVSTVYLFGGMSQIRGAPELLSSLLNIRVQLVKTVSTIRCPERIRLAGCLNAAGALIRL